MWELSDNILSLKCFYMERDFSITGFIAPGICLMGPQKYFSFICISEHL